MYSCLLTGKWTMRSLRMTLSVCFYYVDTGIEIVGQYVGREHSWRLKAVFTSLKQTSFNSII